MGLGLGGVTVCFTWLVCVKCGGGVTVCGVGSGGCDCMFYMASVCDVWGGVWVWEGCDCVFYIHAIHGMRFKGEGGVPWVQIMENEFEYLADRGGHGGHLGEKFVKKYCS